MDNTQQSAPASHPTPEKAKDTPSLWKGLGERWRRVEVLYREWRLLFTIISAVLGTAVTAVAAIARGFDLLTTTVLALAIGALVWLSWDAAARTKKWLPPVLVLFIVVVILSVAATADWRTSVLQLFSDTPPVSLRDVQAKDSANAELRKQVSTLDAELRKVTLERDEAVAALKSEGAKSVAKDPSSFGIAADLMQFFEAYALPAKKDLLPLLNISSGDSDLDVALDTFLPRTINVREAAVVAQLHPGEFNGNVQAFCDYFAAYQETVRWFYKLTDRYPGGNWYTTGNNPQRYKVWLSKDGLFLQQLRVLLADPRFGGMRNCVDTVGYDELLRAR